MRGRWSPAAVGRRAVLGLVLSTLACGASGCGYALAGRGNSLPANIRLIGVPLFSNRSTTPDIDRVLTDAVRTEFQTKGRYRVLPQAEGVDAVLTGTITNVIVQPVAFTTENQVSRNLIIAIASIEFRDLTTDKVIWANPSFQVRDEYEVTTGTTANDPAAIFSQDANALERLSRSFSRSVITAIFEAF